MPSETLTVPGTASNEHFDDNLYHANMQSRLSLMPSTNRNSKDTARRNSVQFLNNGGEHERQITFAASDEVDL
jgi:hypothetical protein